MRPILLMDPMAVRHVFLMCERIVMCSSNITPRFRASADGVICASPTVILICDVAAVRENLEEKCIASVLLSFSARLFLPDHRQISRKQALILEMAVSRSAVLKGKYNWTSSAYIID